MFHMDCSQGGYRGRSPRKNDSVVCSFRAIEHILTVGAYFPFCQKGSHLNMYKIAYHGNTIITYSAIYFTEDKKRNTYPNKQNRYLDVYQKCQCCIIISGSYYLENQTVFFFVAFRGEAQLPSSTAQKGLESPHSNTYAFDQLLLQKEANHGRCFSLTYISFSPEKTCNTP